MHSFNDEFNLLVIVILVFRQKIFFSPFSVKSGGTISSGESLGEGTTAYVLTL